MGPPTTYQKCSIEEAFPAKLFVQAPLGAIDNIAPQARRYALSLLAGEAAFLLDPAMMGSVIQIQKALLTDHWHLIDASCRSPSDPPDRAIFGLITTNLFLLNSGLGKD